MAGFPFSLQGDLASRAPNDASVGIEIPAASDGFEFARPDRGIRHTASLARMVESEIIPRLMLAHRAFQTVVKPTADEQSSPTDDRSSLGDKTTERFARMVVSKEPDSLIAFIGTLLRDGVSMESVYLDLLVPAARRLGEYWDEDSVSFADVTIGLGRLQHVVRALGWKSSGDGETDRLSPSALFAPASGEQHTFGLFIVEESFRRSGWRTWIETSRARRDLIDTIRSHWFDVFGLSASRHTRTEDIADVVKAVRSSSRNENLFVLVGGRVFVERPELVAEVGADATAAGGGEALLIANEALLIAENRVRRVASGS